MFSPRITIPRSRGQCSQLPGQS